MPRTRDRICLQDGLKLDLNRLARQGIVRRGERSWPCAIRWTHSYWGEIASGVISADLSGKWEGWLRIQIGNLDQRIILFPQGRYFGGHQWYFMCPRLNRPASVLWKPPGAQRFCSREAWAPQVAYQSQFLDSAGRAHHGKAKINSKLCLIGKLNSDEWDFPPKPKWMRWRTYNRAEEKFDRYEATLDQGCAALVAKLLGKNVL